MNQQPPPSVPSSSNASLGSSESRRIQGPTISIENVELLEADRQHVGKRNKRGNRQQEAADAAAVAAAQGRQLVGGKPQISYEYSGYDVSQLQQQYPEDLKNYYYAQYGATGVGHLPSYGMPYEGGYVQPGQSCYLPYGYLPQQQLAQPGTGQPGATEYTGLLVYPPPPPPPTSNNLGALSMDDIEKGFNNLVYQSSEVPVGSPIPSIPAGKRLSDKPNPTDKPSSPYSSTKGTSVFPKNASSSPKASSDRRGRENHRRTLSAGFLPPPGPSRSPATRLHQKKEATHRRSLSASPRVGVGAHRRKGSYGRSTSESVGSASVCSHSVVSDISKSALFQGVTREGHVQLVFPYEAVRLVNNRDMERGRLYVQEIRTQEYENFYLADTSGWNPMLDRENHGKGQECVCTCNNCIRCTAKKALLPRLYYALKVDDDLYRRVLDEVSSARTMPCGLFFCGHYEDVSGPSIRIAYLVLGLLFALMGYVAFVFEA